MSRPSLTPGFEERQETMVTLMEEVQTLQLDGDNQENAITRIREIVEESGKLVEQADEPHEMVMDAQILATGSHVMRSHVSAFDTNLTSFIPEDYTSGVMSFVEGQSLQPQLDWDVLASETCSMFKKVAPMSYMLGTCDLDPPPPPEKQKQTKAKKLAEAKKNVVETIQQSQEGGESTDEIYLHILKCLVELYRKNNKKPVSYFEFITDPDDFWRTVENVFHFSFLVRDDKVRMALDDKGLPVVEPVYSKGNVADVAQERKKSCQFNFRLTMGEWRDIRKAFNIKKACIKPFRSA